MEEPPEGVWHYLSTIIVYLFPGRISADIHVLIFEGTNI